MTNDVEPCKIYAYVPCMTRNAETGQKCYISEIMALEWITVDFSTQAKIVSLGYDADKQAWKFEVTV